MALQVWLPLTGDLHNQGLDDITFTQATVAGYEAGKIGQALSLLGTNIAFTASSLEGLTKFSVAFWFKSKTNSSITTSWNNVIAINSSNADESTTTEWRFESSYATSTSYILSAHNNTGEPIMTGTSGLVPERDKWYHVAATCDGESYIKFYINGEHINSDRSYLGGHLRGLVKIANESADPDALLNDLRIYDHCLSPKEVKELSKGLVAHYPLNDGVGGVNILKDSHIEKSGAANVAQWFRWNLTTTLSTNTIYTISFDAKTTVTTDVFYIGWANGDNTQELLSSGVEVIQSYKRYSFTGSTTKTNINSIIISNYKGYGRGNTNNTNGVLSVKNIKLELGEKPTPWIPNSADALYSKMGLDNGVIYDCSGYGHHGVTSPNPPVANSDSIRYFTNLQFNGSNNYIDCGVDTWLPTDQITVSLWGYMTTWGSSRLLSCTEGGGWNFEAGDGGGWRFPVYKKGLGYCFSTPTKKWADYTSGWHHIVGTFDGYVSKIYIDGELDSVSTNQSPTIKKEIGYNQSVKFFIGCEAATANPSSPYFSGKISDVRIYATALSAEDIKSLYETRASIDNYSNTYAYEFMEV